MTKRIIKSHHDVTLTEVTQSDGKNIISRAYSVRAASNPTATKDFGDMGAADTYFEQLIQQRLNPKAPRP
jgi:hypothetical protein